MVMCSCVIVFSNLFNHASVQSTRMDRWCNASRCAGPKKFLLPPNLGACGATRDPNAVARVVAGCNGSNRCGIWVCGSFATSLLDPRQTRHWADARATGCDAMACGAAECIRIVP